MSEVNDVPPPTESISEMLDRALTRAEQAEASLAAMTAERDALWKFYEDAKAVVDGAVVSRAAGPQGETDK